MRISGNPHDPAYLDESRWAVVYLDGALMRHVVTADEESRAIVVEVVDQRGLPVLRDDRIERKVLVGDVRIGFRSDAPTWVRELHPDRIEPGAVD